jgi:hypothetical protein
MYQTILNKRSGSRKAERVGYFLFIVDMRTNNSSSVNIDDLMEKFEKKEITFNELSKMCGGTNITSEELTPVPVI